MICYPNAKINLGLNVVSKRADGYHNLESIFLPIDLCDVLEVLPVKGSGVQLSVYGIEVKGDPSENLVVKAYQLVKSKYDIDGVEAHLLKNIPTGAGMGGGSSDGVFMLKALCEVFELNVSQSEMMEWSAALGSDCPFFLYNQPCFVSGRGEEVMPLSMDVSEYEVCIVHPGIHISTSAAFANITPRPSKLHLQNVTCMPLSDWKKNFMNDFETNAKTNSPVIGEIIDQLYHSGAEYAAMSGSGSSVYGVARKNTLRDIESRYYKRLCHFL